MRALLLSSIALGGISACTGPEEPSRDYAVAVDTLPGGGLHVRNPAQGLWEATGATPWRLQEVTRIGRLEGDGPHVFGRVGSVVEDPAGRIWVADPMAAELRVFDRTGAHVRTVGGKGQGPGEFEDPREMLVGPDGNVWVDDARLRRWEVFDTSGVRVAGHPGNSNLGGGIRVWTADRQLLEANYRPAVEETSTQRVLYRVRTLTPSGELAPADSIFSPAVPRYDGVTFTAPGGRYTMRQVLPLSHRPRAYPGPDGDFWVTEGDGRYIIRRQRVSGDTVLIIERTFDPVPVSAETHRRALEELDPGGGMTADDDLANRLPSVHPPFEDFVAGTDSTLWVRRATEDQQAFDVFDPEGRYLGVVGADFDAADLQIRHITGDHIYAVLEDDLGVQSLVVIQIVRQDGVSQ